MKISGWKEKLLSVGGKEILLKSVTQAIPTYAMSVFKIPKIFCKGIINAISHFWSGTRIIISGCIGWLGGKCVYPKIKGVGGWDSGIFIVST